MKETLKKIYKDQLIESVSEYDFKKYYYFIDSNHHIFGISKNTITDNEFKMICSQYELLSEEIGLDKYQSIINYLFGVSDDDIKLKHLKYYMIKFMNVKDEETYQELNQLLIGSFDESTYLIKKQNIYIMVVDKDKDIQFIDILKSIESDFLIQIVGYESDFFDVNDSLPKYFQFDYKAFVSYKKTNHLVIHKTNLINNNILFNIDENIKKDIKSYILKDFQYDTEMLNVIKMYFETNFNSTLAAKKCYMHRNTFIHKIDKFIQQTHFNVRNYEDAFIVYLALVM
ncbi:helix-turn-helix domain-containing protein [Mycoplasmatota bacterium]|nr:helix-turn-helix domain-containing protein [Mycoplasmatota bacterium]